MVKYSLRKKVFVLYLKRGRLNVEFEQKVWYREALKVLRWDNKSSVEILIIFFIHWLLKYNFPVIRKKINSSMSVRDELNGSKLSDTIFEDNHLHLNKANKIIGTVARFEKRVILFQKLNFAIH